MEPQKEENLVTLLSPIALKEVVSTISERDKRKIQDLFLWREQSRKDAQAGVYPFLPF